jgi:AICAR transformylase/IMP cyclohydrolase PurH
MSMTRSVLLLGRLSVVVEDVQQQLRMPDVQLFGATGLDEVRSAFAQADIDHVIMGAGLGLETRLEIVREIFLTSDKTTVHMKDFASGSDGFLPFVRSVLTGLADYEV